MQGLIAKRRPVVSYVAPRQRTHNVTIEDDERRALLKAVARRLQQTRLLLVSNRTRLAEQYGIHHTMWQKWEDGKSFPSIVVMTKFCRDYGLTLDWIYMGVMKGLDDQTIQRLLWTYPEYLEPQGDAPKRIEINPRDPQSPPAPKLPLPPIPKPVIPRRRRKLREENGEN